ncbi:MAG: DUF4124 domain-containing protein [Pseudomonadota bacterium]
MNSLQLICCGLLVYSASGYTQTYRWVDENGTVSYSQTPPPSGEVEIIKVSPSSKDTSTEATEQLNKLRQQLEDRKEDRQLAEKTRKQAEENAVKREQNCVNAQSNLGKLESQGNRLLRTSDGQYIRLTEAERQARMQTARDNIKANCTR